MGMMIAGLHLAVAVTAVVAVSAGVSSRRHRWPPNLLLRKAIPLVGACENTVTDCISDGRLNQQQRRCGEEQKVFHDILPAFSKDLELATDAAASWRFEQRPCYEEPTDGRFLEDTKTTEQSSRRAVRALLIMRSSQFYACCKMT
jgi:hypothetical protein